MQAIYKTKIVTHGAHMSQRGSHLVNSNSLRFFMKNGKMKTA